MVLDIARLLGQISAETGRLLACLPYATPGMRKIAQDILESQKVIVDPQTIKRLTLDEESVTMTSEQKFKLHMERAQWVTVAEEHLKTLRMASDNIQTQLNSMYQFQMDMQRQFLEFLKRQ